MESGKRLLWTCLLLVAATGGRSMELFLEPPMREVSVSPETADRRSCDSSDGLCVYSSANIGLCNGSSICSKSDHCPGRTDFPAAFDTPLKHAPPAVAACTLTDDVLDLVSAGQGGPQNVTNGGIKFNVSLSSNESCLITRNLTRGEAGLWTVLVWIYSDVSGCRSAGDCTWFSLRREDGNSSRELNLSLMSTTSSATYAIAADGSSANWTLPRARWVHIALQKIRWCALFIDGIRQEGFIDCLPLNNIGFGISGKSLDGTLAYVDMRVYKDEHSLTDREIAHIYNNTWKSLSQFDQCRCPADHPQLSSDAVYCFNKMSRTRRFSGAHLLQYVSDDNVSTLWMTTRTNLTNITFTLPQRKTYQLDTMRIQFGEPLPDLVQVDLRRANGEISQTVGCRGSQCNFVQTENCSELVLDFRNNSVVRQRKEFEKLLASSLELRLEGHRNISCPCHEYYVISEVKVIGRCNCNGNGEVCLNDVCSCHNESQSQGVACDSRSDVGFYRRVDGFAFTQQCKCLGQGSRNKTTCEEVGGDCFCKSKFSESLCNACKPEFWNFSTADFSECQECNCLDIGRVNNVCNMQSGQCECRDNITKTRDCQPMMSKIEPPFGLLSGGTEAIIHGQLLGLTSMNISLFLSSIRQNILHRNDSIIIFETSPGSNHKDSHNATIEITLNTFRAYLGNFLFLRNPKIEYVSHNGTIWSGGCSVYVKGHDFNSIFRPILVFYEQMENGGTVKTTETKCSNPKENMWKCLIPHLSQNKNKTDLVFSLGLELAGFHINLSNFPKVRVMQDPIVKDLGPTWVINCFKSKLEIQGNFLQACNRDIMVIIGKNSSCTIEETTDDKIVCKPPDSLADEDSSHVYDVTVKIGFYRKRIGNLMYEKFTDTREFGYIMAAVVGFTLLIMIVFVQVLVSKCRNRKQIATSQEGNPENVQLDSLISDTDFSEVEKNFLHRLEDSLKNNIKEVLISTTLMKPGRVCKKKGRYGRLIDGYLLDKTNGLGGMKLTVKTPLEKIPEAGALPFWISKMLSDAMLLKNCHHENVLALTGITITLSKFYIFYPYMAELTLKDFLSNLSKELTLCELIRICLQVVDGMKYLSSQRLVHRDLAARNCMVSEDKLIKITDPSLMWDFYPKEYIFDVSQEHYLPARWMAPESLKMALFEIKSDVWSFGVLMWEVFTRGLLPFEQVNDDLVQSYIVQGYRLGKPASVSDNLFSIMQNCWKDISNERPDFFDISDKLQQLLKKSTSDMRATYISMGRGHESYIPCSEPSVDYEYPKTPGAQ